MKLGEGVAVRVSALCLDKDGHLPDRLLFSDAVRAGLLVDLALNGRMTATEDSIVVDATPTGYAPADRLLAAIAAEPERSLDGWLQERRIGLRDIVEANVEAGRWGRRTLPFGLRPRYTDHRRGQTARDLFRSVSPWSEDCSSDDACVTVIAGASGLLDRELGLGQAPSPALLAATGDVAWLCDTVADHLQHAADRYRDQAGALGAGLGAF